MDERLPDEVLNLGSIQPMESLGGPELIIPSWPLHLWILHVCERVRVESKKVEKRRTVLSYTVLTFYLEKHIIVQLQPDAVVDARNPSNWRHL